MSFSLLPPVAVHVLRTPTVYYSSGFGSKRFLFKQELHDICFLKMLHFFPDRWYKPLGSFDLLIFQKKWWYWLHSNRRLASSRVIPEGTISLCYPLMEWEDRANPNFQHSLIKRKVSDANFILQHHGWTAIKKFFQVSYLLRNTCQIPTFHSSLYHTQWSEAISYLDIVCYFGCKHFSVNTENCYNWVSSFLFLFFSLNYCILGHPQATCQATKVSTEVKGILNNLSCWKKIL